MNLWELGSGLFRDVHHDSGLYQELVMVFGYISDNPHTPDWKCPAPIFQGDFGNLVTKLAGRGFGYQFLSLLRSIAEIRGNQTTNTIQNSNYGLFKIYSGVHCLAKTSQYFWSDVEI